jgi:hypothetical protein
MQKLTNDCSLLVLVTVGLAISVIAAPAFAGTVYHWTTDDGTAAYTDDAKRIPAKYKKQATKLKLGKLKNYERFTESKLKFAQPYEKRVDARLDALRGAGAMPAVSAAPPSADGRVRYAVGLSDSDSDLLSFPVDRTSGDRTSAEPIITSEHRVRMRNSIATQDVTVTKQGDRVVSVRVSAPNQSKINQRVDDATASALPIRR